MYRQGDILIVAHKIPENAKKRNSLVILHGEATGHKHLLAPQNGNAAIYDAGSDAFLRLAAPTPLVHEEHDTITLPEGTYKVIRQREYDEGMIRHVTD